SLGFTVGPGFDSNTAVISPASFPTPIVPLPIVNPPVAPYSALNGYATHLQLPYTLQWNTSIEQALGKSQALTVSYVGSHGSRLLQSNVFEPSNNPNASFIYLNENGLT